MKAMRFWFVSAMILCLGLTTYSMGEYPGVGTFEKITSMEDLEDGYYVVANVNDEYAMNNVNPGTLFQQTAISPSDDIIQNPAVSIVWWIEEDGAGWTLYNEDSETYVAYEGSENHAYAHTNVTDAARWVFTYDDEFELESVNVEGRRLRYNASNPRFVAYATTFGQNLSLFQLQPFEDPTLILLIPDTIDQGETIQGSVVITEAAESDLDVDLTSSHPADLQVPASVTISNGMTTATFDIEASPFDDAGAPDIEVTITANADGYDPVEEDITIINTLAGAIALTAEVYEQDFADFVSAETLPHGWSVEGANTTYIGDWGTGTGGGMRGNANVLGYQHTGTTLVFDKIATFRNDTGEEITDLTVSYLGRVARVDETRHPEYTVTVNGDVVPALAYSTSAGADQMRSASLSGLSIAPDAVFEIVWSSDGDVGTTGSRRQIGIGDVSVFAGDPPDDQPPIITLDPPGAAKDVFVNDPITFDVIADQVPGDAGQHTELYATELPGDATFPGATGDAPVQATFDWTPDVVGVYTAIFEAADTDGVTTQKVTIAVQGPGPAPEGTLVLYDFEVDVNYPAQIADNLGWSFFVPSDDRTITYFSGNPGRGISATGWDVAGRYWEFSLTVADGFVMAVNNMSFDERATSTGPTNWYVRSSLDDYTADLAGGPINNDSNWDEQSFALSIAGASGMVTFRIYADGASAGTGPWRLDNVTLLGEVALGGLRVSVDKPDGFKVEQGTVEMITATAEDGEPPYEYDWESDLNESHWDADDNVFTILASAPAGDYYAKVMVEDDEEETADTTVNFTVAPKYPIVITPPANGLVETVPTNSAFADDPVTIIADPDPGFVVDDITVTGDDTTVITVTDNTFTMPAQGVTVTVMFEEIPIPEGLLAFYDFTDDSVDATLTAPLVDASEFEVSAGSVGFGWSHASQWEALGAEEPYAESGGGWTEDNQASAKHFSFELTVGGGESMTITNISFLQRRTPAGPAMTGVSIDDVSIYAEELGQDEVVAVSIPITGYVDITGAVIRIDGWDGGTGDFRVDNVLVQGMVGEPGLSVSVDKPDGFRVEQGTEETITATAVDGEPPYVYDWESDLGATFYTTNNNVFTILATAPAGDYYAKVTVEDEEEETADTTVNFTVAPKYPIVITPPANGLVETDPEDSAFADDPVTIIADPDPGFVADEITVTGDDTTVITVTDNTFTMPAQGVTVEVVFEEIPIPEGLLAFYDFTDDSVDATLTAPLVDASEFEVSAGSVGFGWSHASQWEALGAEEPYAESGGGWDEEDQASAKHFSFELTVGGGDSMTITNISFLQRRTGAGPVMTGVSIDDASIYAEELEQDEVVSVSIPVAGYVDITGAVIRIAGWDGGGGDYRVDNVLVQGLVDDDPPPEPDEPEFDEFVVAAGVPAQAHIMNSQEGYTYILEYTTDLTDPEGWEIVESKDGTGGALMLEDVDPADVMRIYRIRVIPTP